MNNVEMWERERGGVSGEANAGHTGEREEIRRVRVVTWADEARDAGGDAHLFSVVTPSYRRSGTAARTGVGKRRVEGASAVAGLRGLDT